MVIGSTVESMSKIVSEEVLAGVPFRGKLPHLVVCGIFHKTNRPKLFCLKEGMVAFAVSLTLTGRVLRRAGSLTH